MRTLQAACVTTIPLQDPFLETLVRTLSDSYRNNPGALARLTLFLPNNRSRRLATELFLAGAEEGVTLLPRMISLGEDFTELADLRALTDFDIPPPLPPLKRQTLLARLVHGYAQAPGSPFPDLSEAGAMEMARGLARLFDEMQTHRIEWENLQSLTPDDLAVHWQKTLTFLNVIRDQWPGILAAHHASDPADYRNRIFLKLLLAWDQHPPADPVMIAGTTGSLPATADLMQKIASLDNGYVVLPGLDTEMDAGVWENLPPTHPQYLLKQTLERMEIRRSDVELWPGCETSSSSFWMKAFSPEPATSPAGLADNQKVFAFEAGERDEEARYIATVLRGVAETPGQTGLVVTADDDLAVRVKAQLRRWDIEINDVRGQPLIETPEASLFLLIMQAMEENFHPVALLSLLGHPLCNLGMGRVQVRAAAFDLNDKLRGPAPAPGLESLARLCAGEPALKRLIESLAAAFAPLQRASLRRVQEWVSAHIETFEAVLGDPRTWDFERENSFAAFLSEFWESAENLEFQTGEDYMLVAQDLLRQRTVHPVRPTHPRLSILNLMEARLLRADVVICAGLNEESWPPGPSVDPWLSRPMRSQLGLPNPDTRVGQSAHDFLHQVHSPEVHLTRSHRIDGKVQLASRFWWRAMTAAKRAGLDFIASNPVAYWLQEDEVRHTASEAIAPPMPKPPIARRPRRYTLSDLQTLMNNPYEFYARRILNLKRLDDLALDPQAADYGEFLHETLKQYFIRPVGGDSWPHLQSIGQQLFEEMFPQRPAVRAFWWPHFVSAGQWFVAEDKLRAPHRQAVHVEVTGNLNVAGHEITARADRIDILKDGRITVIDYKSGGVPNVGEIKSGLKPQLLIEAWMLTQNAFPDLAASADQISVEYWKMGGGRRGGEVKDMRTLPVPEEIPLTEAGIRQLVETFANEETPYLAEPDPSIDIRYSDYRHLARVGEWRGVGGES